MSKSEPVVIFLDRNAEAAAACERGGPGCRLLKQTRSTHYYLSVKEPRPICGRVRMRLREVVSVMAIAVFTSCSSGRAWRLGRNRAYQIYREVGLQLRSKLARRRKMMATHRERIQPQDARMAAFAEHERPVRVVKRP